MTTEKCRQKHPKVTPAIQYNANSLANHIDEVATLMSALSEQMEYYAGFSSEMIKHAREMAGASVIAHGWAKEIRKPNRKPKGKTP